MNTSLNSQIPAAHSLSGEGTVIGVVGAPSARADTNQPASGGGISLASIGVIATQAEGGVTADPFSIAFTLQAILFLISSVLNFRSDRPAPRAMGCSHRRKRNFLPLNLLYEKKISSNFRKAG